MSELILIRGLPGSGKTTLSKELINEGLRQGDTDIRGYEADDFFYRGIGNGEADYFFDKDFLKYAHAKCLSNTAQALYHVATAKVFVSNTFTTKWGLEDYLDLARVVGASVTIIHCDGEYDSVHDVPQETIERMKGRFVDNLELQKQYAEDAWRSSQAKYYNTNIVFKQYTPETDTMVKQGTLFIRRDDLV